jgi:hypothetical protein
MVDRREEGMESPEPLAQSQEPKRPDGKTSLRRLSRMAVVAAGIVLALGIAAAYVGVQPLATWKDVLQQRLAPFEDVRLPAPTDVYPRTRQFSGTYVTTVPVLDYEQSLTFKGDTLTLVDAFAGTFVYRYTATMESDTEGVLEMEDADSGLVSHVPLKYVPDADCLILYDRGTEEEGITYCR